MTDSNTQTATFSSGFDLLEQLENFVDKLRSWAGFNKELYDNILLVLSEAVANALVHGNKRDPEKKVKVTARLNRGELLKIDIKDEGEGFDPSGLPDPLEDENLLKAGGRGVFIIKQYAEHAEYSEDGTRLTLHFLLGDKKNG